jgi:unspecific monooxygenase
VQDPYPLYAEVLTGDPVRYWEDYGMIAVFDARGVQSLLRDRRLGRAIPPDQKWPTPDHLRDFAAVEDLSMLDLEPPAHTRLRGLVLRAFTTRRIQSLAPDIAAVAHELIASFPQSPFDLLPAYCSLLPVRIIARLLGVPEAMAPDLLRWSNAMVAMYQANRSRDTEDAANSAARDFATFLGDHIDARRATPGDDLISTLIRAQDETGALSRQEMISTCVLLLNAGHEATVHTLGNAVKTLLEHNTPLRDLRAPDIVNTVEEVLLYDPPLHLFTRYAYKDLFIGRHLLQKGEQVALVLGSAGRDPALCPVPQQFDPRRSPVSHSAFGGGLHFCLGAPLARLELQIGLSMLFEHTPHLKHAGPFRYADSYHFHGLSELLVTT